MMRSVRLATVLVCSLLLGASVSFVVAQAVVYFGDHPPRRYRIYITDRVMGGQWRSAWGVTVVLIREGYLPPLHCGNQITPDPKVLPQYAINDPANHRLMTSADVPYWARYPDRSKGFYTPMISAGYGWPFRSMRWTEARLRGQGMVLLEARYVDLTRFGFKNHRNYPTKVLWPGMLANASIYGAPTFAFFGFCSPAVRTARRRRRGVCPRCKYDLVHDYDSGCPECGWNRADD